MVRSRHKPRLKLSFSIFECPCGERERVRGVPCPTCNRRPDVHEFDVLVQRRQRVAAAVRSTEPERNLEFRSADPMVFAEIFDELHGWIDDFLDALNRLDDGVETARMLTAHLLGLHEAFAAVARLRPWRGLYGYVETALKAIVDVWSKTLDVFTARTMIDAQRGQVQLQKYLDTAVEAIDDWGLKIDQMMTLADMTPNDQVVAGASWGLGTESDSIIFADKIIEKTGISSPQIFAVRQFIALGVELANVGGERAELGRLTQDTLSALRANTDKCREIINLQAFQEAFAQAIGEMYRSSSMTHALGTSSGNERLAVEALVKSAHNLVESSTRHTVTLLAASLLPTGYRSTLEKGAAECIRTLRSGNLSDLTVGLDLDLRHAEAHRSWRITADGGLDILNDRRNVKRHITASELLDIVIAGNITSFSMVAAVMLFACEVDLDVTTLLDTDEPMPFTAIMQVITLAFGWPRPDVEISPSGAEITLRNVPNIEITFDLQFENPINVALALAKKTPDHVEKILLYDGRHDEPITMITADLRAILAEKEEFSKHLAFIRLFNSIRRGDKRLISPDLWQDFVRGVCEQALTDSRIPALKKLLSVRKTLRDCRDDTATEGVTAVIENLRRAISGQQDIDTSTLVTELPGSRGFTPSGWLRF